jgi:hypothetical protein
MAAANELLQEAGSKKSEEEKQNDRRVAGSRTDVTRALQLRALEGLQPSGTR